MCKTHILKLFNTYVSRALSYQNTALFDKSMKFGTNVDQTILKRFGCGAISDLTSKGQISRSKVKFRGHQGHFSLFYKI